MSYAVRFLSVSAPQLMNRCESAHNSATSLITGRCHTIIARLSSSSIELHLKMILHCTV